jgi:hypothetical protein
VTRAEERASRLSIFERPSMWGSFMDKVCGERKTRGAGVEVGVVLEVLSFAKRHRS